MRRQCYSRKILSNLKKIKNKGYGRIIYFAYKISSEIAPAVDTIMHLQVRGSGHLWNQTPTAAARTPCSSIVRLK